jgi:hypothetical protein
VASAAGSAAPVSRTGRDIGILALVMVVLVGVVRAGASMEHAVPVSLGNASITNANEVVADAEARFDEWVEGGATRVSEDAGCYFFRPLGPTQGAVPAGMFPPGLLPGGEGAEGIDLLMCGPVEMSTESIDALPGTEPQPWLTGIVYYFPTDAPNALRGEFQTMLQSSLAVLATSGALTSDALIAADGRRPSDSSIEDPEWRDVTPTGDMPPVVPGMPGSGTGGAGTGGTGGGVELPPGVSVPELPPGVTVPPGMSIPEMPELPEMPGTTLPGSPGG